MNGKFKILAAAVGISLSVCSANVVEAAENTVFDPITTVTVVSESEDLSAITSIDESMENLAPPPRRYGPPPAPRYGPRPAPRHDPPPPPPPHRRDRYDGRHRPPPPPPPPPPRHRQPPPRW